MTVHEINDGVNITVPKEMSGMFKYSPALFTGVTNMTEAAKVILTPEGEQDTPQRWDTETPYIAQLIDDKFPLDSNCTVLDFGCGIGRNARELISRFSCKVIGVDISPNMLTMATSYVDSPNFIPVRPEALDWLNLDFDLAISVWCLQHVYDPLESIRYLRRFLPVGVGHLFVAEQLERSMPTEQCVWVNDTVRVKDLLEYELETIAEGHPDTPYVSEPLAKRSFWGLYKNVSEV